ncbi:hypothetical protein F2Q70_00039247 [Brassica cretica]|uniref:Uncharacterized protein n=1 Tax=Brassica cretica TaxID=69181 RepID=A0A8S9MCZ8_BRACR|nr:hypothetical protein F2Q70_00039247 [Brassica cretica]KAF2617920.1 hypothetical protein F2Q68_00039938 [Brassica cretica]
MGGKGGKVLYTLSTVGLEDVTGFGAVGAIGLRFLNVFGVVWLSLFRGKLRLRLKVIKHYWLRSTLPVSLNFRGFINGDTLFYVRGFVISAGKTRFTKLRVLIMKVHFIYGLSPSFEIHRVIVFYFKNSGFVLIC